MFQERKNRIDSVIESKNSNDSMNGKNRNDKNKNNPVKKEEEKKKEEEEEGGKSSHPSYHQMQQRNQRGVQETGKKTARQPSMASEKSDWIEG